jgi:primosomal protein N' (replication factor Y)
MLRERCARDNAPLWATSCIPSPVLVNSSPFEKTDDLTTGWPSVQIIDRRNSDPRDGVLSREAVDAAHKALNSDEQVAVVVVLQRLGTGKLFVCQKCGELARCPQCSQAEEEVGEFLSCADRHEMRGNFCLHCGATNLRRVRTGVTTLARDVGAQLSQEVSEITGASDLEGSLHRVVVGTEAVWQRVRHCGVVIFVDFDQYLLAPRESARRSALSAVAKAGRLVGARKDAKGEVVLQTRRSQDVVLRSLQSLDFSELMKDDDLDSQVLKLPPYGALATVSGESSQAFVSKLSDSRVSIHQSGDTFELRSDSLDVLCQLLKDAERPAGKFRVAIA